MVFIDATKDFQKDGNKNRLVHLEKILTTLNQRHAIKNYCHVASANDIAANDYSLNVNAYVDIQIEHPEINIKQLNKEVKEAHKRQKKAMKKWDKMIKYADSGYDKAYEPKFMQRK